MAGYDPRRSRPRPAVVPPEKDAPVDALLGPESGPDDATPLQPRVVVDPVTSEPEAQPAIRSAAGTWPAASRRGAPSRAAQLAPLIALGVVLAVLAWFWSRRR